MEMEQGVSAGLGITIDPMGEAVVLIMVGTKADGNVAVPVTPDVALAFARGMKEMAREAQVLQDEIEDLSAEELQDRLTAIQNRFAAETN
jgi:hypothetical protein